MDETWHAYLEEVEWFFYSVRPKDRHRIASKLVRRLTGSAKQAIKGLKPREFTGREGIPKLLGILQGRLGDLPVPDLAAKLDEFVFRLKRKAGETISEWGLRSTECYRRLCTALERVKGGKPSLGDYSDFHEFADESNYVDDNEWGDPIAEEPEEGEEETEAPRRGKNGPRVPTARSKSRDKGDDAQSVASVKSSKARRVQRRTHS